MSPKKKIFCIYILHSLSLLYLSRSTLIFSSHHIPSQSITLYFISSVISAMLSLFFTLKLYFATLLQNFSLGRRFKLAHLWDSTITKEQCNTRWEFNGKSHLFYIIFRTINFSYFLPNSLPVLTCHQVIRRGRRLAASPTSNTQKYSIAIRIFHSIVTCRTIAKQQLCKQVIM